MTNNIMNWLDILVFFFKESLKRETTFKADFSYLLVFPCTCSQDEDISVELACLRKEITHEHGKKKHFSPSNSPEYGVATFYKDSNAPCWDFSVEALPWNYKGLVGELSRAVYLFITNNMPTARISNFKSIMHQQIKEHGKFWAWCYWQLLLNISLKNVKVRKFSLRINLLVSQNVYKKSLHLSQIALEHVEVQVETLCPQEQAELSLLGVEVRYTEVSLSSEGVVAPPQACWVLLGMRWVSPVVFLWKHFGVEVVSVLEYLIWWELTWHFVDQLRKEVQV